MSITDKQTDDRWMGDSI